MQLNVVQVNSQHFNHFPGTQRLVAEISSIGVRHFQPLYSDAVDVGFALRNPRTGNVTRWALSDEIRCPQEGDILGWYLKPTPESIRANPILQGYTMTLIND
jgi:hypothetical protein